LVTVRDAVIAKSNVAVYPAPPATTAPAQLFESPQLPPLLTAQLPSAACALRPAKQQAQAEAQKIRRLVVMSLSFIPSG